MAGHPRSPFCVVTRCSSPTGALRDETNTVAGETSEWHDRRPRFQRPRCLLVGDAMGIAWQKRPLGTRLHARQDVIGSWCPPNPPNLHTGNPVQFIRETYFTCNRTLPRKPVNIPFREIFCLYLLFYLLNKVLNYLTWLKWRKSSLKVGKAKVE